MDGARSLTPHLTRITEQIIPVIGQLRNTIGDSARYRGPYSRTGRTLSHSLSGAEAPSLDSIIRGVISIAVRFL